MKKRYFHLTMILILFIILIISLSYKPNSSSKYTDDKTSLVSNENTTVSSDLDEIQLQKINNNNNDIKAILSIENSNLKELVVQTTDNDYYLEHNYKKEKAKLGAIYADYRISLDKSQKILIYGHSSTKTNTPFNYLENYYDSHFYENHKYITLQTQNNIYKYEIFSVYVETTDFTYMNLNFSSKQDWYSHILKLKNKSLYQTNVEINEEDDILILQTCSNNPKYKNYSNKYLLIVSRRVK